MPLREQCRIRQGSGAERDVHAEIEAELARALAKYPDCASLPNGTGASGYKTFERIAKQSCERAYREGRCTHAHIFEEEVAEVLAQDDPAEIRKELVQVAAMAVKWIRDIDRKASNDCHGTSGEAPKVDDPRARDPREAEDPGKAAAEQGSGSASGNPPTNKTPESSRRDDNEKGPAADNANGPGGPIPADAVEARRTHYGPLSNRKGETHGNDPSEVQGAERGDLRELRNSEAQRREREAPYGQRSVVELDARGPVVHDDQQSGLAGQDEAGRVLLPRLHGDDGGGAVAAGAVASASAAPVAEPTQPVCRDWCGNPSKPGVRPCREAGDIDVCRQTGTAREGCFCTPACRDAGRPLNPPPVPPGYQVVGVSGGPGTSEPECTWVVKVPPGPVPPQEPKHSTEDMLRSLAKPRTTVKRFASELKARIARVEAAFSKPGQEQWVDGAHYVQGVVDALLSDYDVRDPEDGFKSAAPSASGPVPPKGEPVLLDVHEDPVTGEPLFTPAAAPAKAPLSDTVRRMGWPTMAVEVASLESQLAAALRELADEKAGAQALRERLGAKDNETFPLFIERLAAERDEQRERAERAEAILADVSRRYGFVQQEADARMEKAGDDFDQLQAVCEAMREQVDIALKKAARAEKADARVAEARRTGWADGAKAMREAIAKASTGRTMGEAQRRADEVLRLPLPVCPEGPPADAGTGAVMSGEAAKCAGCLALLERAAEMLADVQEEPDGWQEWVADRETYMHARADAIKAAVASERERCLWWARARIERGVLPLTALIDDIADGHAVPSGADAPGAGK